MNTNGESSSTKDIQDLPAELIIESLKKASSFEDVEVFARTNQRNRAIVEQNRPAIYGAILAEVPIAQRAPTILQFFRPELNRYRWGSEQVDAVLGLVNVENLPNPVHRTRVLSMLGRHPQATHQQLNTVLAQVNQDNLPKSIYRAGVLSAVANNPQATATQLDAVLSQVNSGNLTRPDDRGMVLMGVGSNPKASDTQLDAINAQVNPDNLPDPEFRKNLHATVERNRQAKAASNGKGKGKAPADSGDQQLPADSTSETKSESGGVTPEELAAIRRMEREAALREAQTTIGVAGPSHSGVASAAAGVLPSAGSKRKNRDFSEATEFTSADYETLRATPLTIDEIGQIAAATQALSPSSAWATPGQNYANAAPVGRLDNANRTFIFVLDGANPNTPRPRVVLVPPEYVSGRESELDGLVAQNRNKVPAKREKVSVKVPSVKEQDQRNNEQPPPKKKQQR